MDKSEAIETMASHIQKRGEATPFLSRYISHLVSSLITPNPPFVNRHIEAIAWMRDYIKVYNNDTKILFGIWSAALDTEMLSDHEKNFIAVSIVDIVALQILVGNPTPDYVTSVLDKLSAWDGLDASIKVKMASIHQEK